MKAKRHNILVLLYLTAMGLAGGPTGAQEMLQPGAWRAIRLAELAEAEPDLTGLSVTVGMVELNQAAGLDMAASCFLPNLEHRALTDLDVGGIYCSDHLLENPFYSAHATLIAGILAGSDTEASYPGVDPFVYQGLVPSAEIRLYETNWFIMNRIFSLGAEELDAEDILTMSWGTTANDVVTRWWQRGVDAYAERTGSLVVAGCGNGASPDAGISKPSWGHNVLSVGAARGLGEFPDYLHYVGPPRAAESSFGPARDGRAKPDLIAPGLFLAPSAETEGDYVVANEPVSYTSFAAPVVAGVAGILLDAARLEGWDDAEDPRVIKALLLNGANKLAGWHHGEENPNDDENVPLDYAQGAGLVDAYASLRQLQAGQFDPDWVESNSGWDFESIDPAEPNDPMRIYVLPDTLAAGDSVKATMCWFHSYHPDRFFTARPLPVLDLELWRLDADGAFDALLARSVSRVDNLQHIYYSSPDEQQVALVVRYVRTKDSNGLPVAYGFAFTSEQENWEGDLLAGDLNVDGIVDAFDVLPVIIASVRQEGIEVTASDWGAKIERSLDVNFDGQVNQLDVEQLRSQWQQHSPWYRGPVEE